ncbi:hypothetical protein D7D52_07605 [Nocardia yunnanensis]|uniref:O-antigen polysaccharide polymerase Wzy n=1 Tax=Nocardia yunnanensis TaxID=2382165 RepID=A0A386Z956_9NOCA|nr:hypothetical protein [Nocardia yunnanensis]AYF73747.1 hypothetical protein D7D52_07605 [Nocardia yunnanensis]
MAPAQIAVFLVAAALATIVVAAMYLPGVARVFLIAQAAHWSLSYVARPVVLLWVRPVPSFGDNVPDPRLYEYGYDGGIAAVLQPVIFGLWVYTGLIVAYVLWVRLGPRVRTPRVAPFAGDPVFQQTLFLLYGIGTLGRLAAYATGTTGKAGELESPNPLINLVTILATLGAVGLIVFYRNDSGRHTALVVGALTCGELVWTATVQSKTPIMGAALAIAVRFAMTGWTRRNVIGVLSIIAVALGGFGWLQSLKTDAAAKADAAQVDAQYPAVVQPFLSMLRRFDLLEAATDAWFAGPSSWLTPGEVLRHSYQSLIPTQLLGAEKFRSGAAWAEQVRGRSVDMSTVEVSLAEGNINEGYVLGGYLGVAVGVAITFVLLLIWIHSLYSKYLAIAILGLSVIEVPVLFERGILGTVEMLGKYLQAVVLAWLAYLVVGELRRRMEQLSGAPAPSGKTRTAQWV